MLRIVFDFHINYAQASIFTQVNNGLSVGWRGGGGGVGKWEEVSGSVGQWSVGLWWVILMKP